MSDPDEVPTAADRLPDDLIHRLDSLEIPDLEAVLSYVEHRIESLCTPIEEEIMASTSGDIVDIEDYGAYTLVRKRLPPPDDSAANTDIVSIFHVSRERHPDGEESLHWSYLGDVHDSDQVKCTTCGRTLDEDGDVCPHCGSDEIDRSEMEE